MNDPSHEDLHAGRALAASPASMALKVLLGSLALVVAGLALSTWSNAATTQWSLAALASCVGAFALASGSRRTNAPASGRKLLRVLRGLAVGAALAVVGLALTLVLAVAGVAVDGLLQP